MSDLDALPYDLELPRICELINAKRYKRVGLQLPEGMKVHAQAIATHISTHTGALVLTSGKPSYGACDIGLNMDVDYLVHFGHARMLAPEVPHYFAECRSKLDVSEIVGKATDELHGAVGVLTTVQHVDKIPSITEILIHNDLKPHIGRPSERTRYTGQVLGCDFTAARTITNDVDSYLYVGSGDFHALGVALATDKEVRIADPERREVRVIGELRERTLRRRSAAIAKAADADAFCVIIGEKRGQCRLALALRLKRLIERSGKRAQLVALDEIRPELLYPFAADCYVCTACPRIPIEDQAVYDRPMLTAPELEIALGHRKFEDYVMDEI